MIKSYLLIPILTLIFGIFQVIAQPGYTANDSVFHYQGQFRAGYNSGFAAGWNDVTLATLAAGDPKKYIKGVGLRSNRDALFFEALEIQGYDTKLNEVEHYDSLNLRDLTALILGGEAGDRPEPPAPYRDTTFYCPDKQSTLFANLYTPIWDGGANGTPYNDDNYFAAYMYKTVDMYKDYITFWEIWNEPGFDFTGNRGWRMPGDTVGNWWDADPNPCDYKLYAPVEHYVRTLRIAWEITKTLDPNSFVCMGAPGFPSFVDAVCRNTDNPNGGGVTPDYPLLGGAYFDAITYHSFPHFDGAFLVDPAKFTLKRNSDRAANWLVTQRNNFQKVFDKYGYDDVTYPKKEFIITEINLPRRIINYHPQTYGGQLAQRSYMMKAFLNAKINNIWQMHVYTFTELRPDALATDDFQVMGLYLNMDNTDFYSAQPTDAGIGVSTIAPLLWNTVHDPVRSAQLTLDTTVRVEAFKRPDGKYIYAMWAVMDGDFNEFGTYNYTFPSTVPHPQFFKKYLWTHSITGQTYVTGDHDVMLDGTPMFLVEESIGNLPKPDFTVSARSGCIPYTVTYTDLSVDADSVSWYFPGGTPQTSSERNPTVTYTDKGYHTVKLTGFNSFGFSENVQDYYMHARDTPVAFFYYTPLFGNVFFLNASQDADTFQWDFGDGGTSTEEYPAHTYFKNGKYLVTLTVTNPCGSNVYRDTVEILYALEMDFSQSDSIGCAPFTVTYTADSPLATEYKWYFPGGTPDTSDLENPVVVYDEAGFYPVSLTVANGNSSNTLTKQGVVRIIQEPISDIGLTIRGISVDLFNGANHATDIFWDFGDGTTSTDTASNITHSYSAPGTYIIRLISSNSCGSDTLSREIEIAIPPVANFSSSNTSGCLPLTVDFQSLGFFSPSDRYYWQFPGGDILESNLKNPSVTYNQPGVYPVFYRITNQVGVDSTLRVGFVTVSDRPSAAGSISNNLLQITYTNQTLASSTVLWDFGDGNISISQSGTHTYQFPGSYIIRLLVGNSCGVDTLVQNLAISIPPSVDVEPASSMGCAPLAVSFNGLGYFGPSDSYYWEFPGGNPSTSTASNPVIQYAQPGSYPVFYKISNPAGVDSVLIGGAVEVTVLPEAAFTSSNTNLTYDFQNLSIGATEYLWDFGDGATSSLPDPVHTFAVPGDYLVTLVVRNPCGLDTIQENYKVVLLPSAQISQDEELGCPPLVIQYGGLGVFGGNQTYYWEFPGGNPATSILPNPVVTYTQPGNYNVFYKISNSLGADSITVLNAAMVLAGPPATFTSTNDQLEFSFVSTGVGASQYQWSFGDGQTSNLPNPTYTYAAPGTYSVRLITTNSCGTDTMTQTVVAALKPNAQFMLSNSIGCAPLVSSFTALGIFGGNQQYYWEFPGGNPATSTESNPVVTYALAGTYPVFYKVSNIAGADSILRMDAVRVDNVPNAGFASNTIGNLGLILVNQSINADSYLWDFGDGTTSTAQNPEHYFGSPGTYDITLIAGNGCGKDTTRTSLTFEPYPTAIIAMNLESGCAPLVVQFSNLGTGPFDNINWEFPGGSPSLSTEANPIVTYSTGGNFPATLRVSNNSGEAVDVSVPVEVLSRPFPFFGFVISNDTVFFQNQTSPILAGTSYLWDFGDGSSSTEFAPNHVFGAGTYTVRLTAQNDCGTGNYQFSVTIITSSIDLPGGGRMVLFPNPARENLNLRYEGTDHIRQLDVQVFNSLGQKVLERPNHSLNQTLELGTLSAGHYWVKLQHPTFGAVTLPVVVID